MRVIVDTNVFVSGVFFAGPPARVVDAWRRGRIQLVLSSEILDEYVRVMRDLSRRYHGVDLEPLLSVLAARPERVRAAKLSEAVCTDPDDDKFLACALAADVRVIVSGDRALKRVSGWNGIEVLSPRHFVDAHL